MITINDTKKTPTSQAPAELTEYPQWVCWRREERDGKQTKIPYRADGRGMASTTDSKTWASYQAACDTYSKGGFDGIGFVFTATCPFTGIDLDHCRNPETGELEKWASDIVASLNSYSEITPSNSGIHIIVKGKLPPGGNRKGPLEFYDHARYFTITGAHLEGTPDTIEDRQRELNDLHAKTFPKAAPASKPGGNGSHPIDLADNELISKAMIAANGAAFTALWNGDTSDHGGDDIGLQVMDNTLLAYPGSGQPNLTDEDIDTVTVFNALLCEVTAVPQCLAVALSWAGVSAERYDIYRSFIGPNTGFQFIGSSMTNSKVAGSFVMDKNHWYRIMAVKNGVEYLSKAVLVNGNPSLCNPTARPGGPYQGCVGQPVTLDGSASTALAGVIIKWEWDLDNDGQYDDACRLRRRPLTKFLRRLRLRRLFSRHRQAPPARLASRN